MTSHNHSKRRREDLALKKSQRDLERSRVWDELNGIYATCAAMLYQHKSLADLAQDKELIGYITDKHTLVMNIRSLAQDLQFLNAELTKLHTQHTGKTKGATTPEEMMQAFQIAEQYNLFMERHNAVVLPTVYYVLEVFQQAELAREAAQARLTPEAIQAAAQSTADTGAIDVPHRVVPAEQPVSETPAAEGSMPAGYTLQ